MSGPDPDAPDALTNAPIDAEGLPHVDRHPFTELDPAYVRIRTMVAMVVGAVVVVATVIAAVLTKSLALALGGAGLVCLVVALGVVNRIEVRYMGYLVRDHDLSFCRGVISRSVATVPFARVQHVSIERGPLDRRFGLASVQLRTAGGSVSIPGLAVERAERLKQLVADRAGELADAEIDTDIAQR